MENTALDPWAFTSRSYITGLPIRVVYALNILSTNIAIYVNPTSANLAAQTPSCTATGPYDDAYLGQFSLGPYGSPTIPGVGALFWRISVSTNYSDVFNFTATPLAYFSATPVSGASPLLVKFTDNSSGVLPMTNYWNLGDGTLVTNGAGTSFTHTYAAGTYSVSLTASNSLGTNTLVSSNLITVTNAAPTDPFVAWQVQYYGSGYATNPAAAASADPLGKGISNTNQFLLGLNPTNSASVFRITSVSATTSNATIVWKTAGVKINVVQGSVGTANHSYSNNFTDISGGIIINVAGDTSTNYVDQSGTNRYYRIRLGP